MTIREHYQRVFDRIKYGSIAAAIAVVLAFQWKYPHLPKPQWLAFALMMGLVFSLLLATLSHIVYRCPRCHADFRTLRIQQMGRWNRDQRFYWQLWDACPRCQLSFDAPWDGASR